jgi:xylulokinase
MSLNILLGVDIGSSGVKAILLDPAWGIIASTHHPVQQFTELPGWSEADTNEWWNGFTNAIPKLFGQSNVQPKDIKGIAFSGMVPALVAVDEHGKPVRRAILQNDSRAIGEVTHLKNFLSDFDLLTITGSVPSQQWITPKINWLAKHEPGNFKKIRYIMGSYDWMAHTLGAKLHVEENWSLESGLFTLEGSVFERIYEAVPVKWPEIPEVKRSSEIIGHISKSASVSCGLLAGTPIYVGGADHVLSAYGAGLINEGDTLIKLGGAGDVLAVSNKLILSPNLYIDTHPIPNKWLPNGCMATSGSILRWEQKLLNETSGEQLDVEARQCKPGSLLMLPYFLGEKTPLHDPSLRGALLGMHLGTTRGEIHRAILESIAFGFRRHVEIFRDLKINVHDIKVTNGGSKSILWKEIIADVLQIDVISIPSHPGASFGAAICAGVGSGILNEWKVGLNLLEQGQTIAHDPKKQQLYNTRYYEFIEATKSLTNILHSISKSQSET